MAKIFLTHTPDMLANYYGPRALAELRKLGDVRLNETGGVLDADALAQAARGCEIVVSDRQTPGPAGFFRQAADCVAFLRVAIDIRNIDVEAASREGILVTQATAGFIPAVAEMAIGMMVDLGRHVTRSTIEYRSGKDAEPRMGKQLKGATLGILGYGQIGIYLAKLAMALGMRVLVHDPYQRVDESGISSGRLWSSAVAVRLRGLPCRRKRADRESDQCRSLRADETRCVLHQSVARQSRR